MGFKEDHGGRLQSDVLFASRRDCQTTRLAFFYLDSLLLFAMSDLPSLLLASLNPTTRKLAEQNLNALSLQPGFLSHLLRLILDATKERPVRLAGSVFLKNIARLRWEEVL